jgi:L-lactate dehydrogenase complex protein LldG
MKAREEILQRVRSANVATPHQPVRRDYAHTVELADPVATFVERVEDYEAAVIRTRPDGVAAAVAKCLEGAGRVVVPAGFNASWLPRASTPSRTSRP